MEATVLFISNGGMTKIFLEMARALEREGIRTVWIATHPRWVAWLQSEGVRSKDLLVLNRQKAKVVKIDPSAAKMMFEQVQVHTGFSQADLVYLDRVLRSWQPEEAIRYLEYAGKELEAFLARNNIGLVYSETTWAHEVLAGGLIGLRGGRQLFPLTVRFPSDRFAFFTGPRVSDPMELATVKDSHLAAARQLVDLFRANKPRPNFWHWWSKAPCLNFKLLKKYSTKLLESTTVPWVDPTNKSILNYFRRERAFLRPFRHMGARAAGVFEQPVQGESFVLLTLHKEPESSIDVAGSPFFTDQLQTAQLISRLLPHGWKLYIKEHALAQGNRSVAELRRMKRLINTRLIDPMYPIHPLIEHAEVIVSISGTVCLEAGLYGKKAILLSPQYFRKLPTVHEARTPGDLRALLRPTSTQPGSGLDAEIHTFLGWVLANSFEGIVADAEAVPQVMSAENIGKVCAATIVATHAIFSKSPAPASAP